MSFRPRNRCLDCNATWHPRGQNVSHKCPRCGSRDIQVIRVPVAAAASLGGVGCLALLVVSCCGLGVVGRLARGPEAERWDEPRAPVVRNNPQPAGQPVNAGRPQGGLGGGGGFDPNFGRPAPPPRPADPSPKPADPPPADDKGTLVLQNSVPVAKDVTAWVEVNGKKVADWKVGTTELSLPQEPGKKRVTVKMTYHGRQRTVYDKDVTIESGQKLVIQVG